MAEVKGGFASGIDGDILPGNTIGRDGLLYNAGSRLGLIPVKPDTASLTGLGSFAHSLPKVPFVPAIPG